MNPTGQPMGEMPSSGGAKEAVNVVSILLMVIAGLGVLFAIYGLITGGGNAAQMDQLMQDPNARQYKDVIENIQRGSRVFAGIGLVMYGVMFFGALKMRNLQSFGLAMAACILGMIPCTGCCCILGLPIGIWGLVVLNKPEVKSAFS